MSPQQWIEFGAAMKKFHSTEFPEEITRSVQREAVKTFLGRIEKETFDEPVTEQMAGFLKKEAARPLSLFIGPSCWRKPFRNSRSISSSATPISTVGIY